MGFLDNFRKDLKKDLKKASNLTLKAGKGAASGGFDFAKDIIDNPVTSYTLNKTTDAIKYLPGLPMTLLLLHRITLAHWHSVRPQEHKALGHRLAVRPCLLGVRARPMTSRLTLQPGWLLKDSRLQ